MFSICHEFLDSQVTLEKHIFKYLFFKSVLRMRKTNKGCGFLRRVYRAVICQRFNCPYLIAARRLRLVFGPVFMKSEPLQFRRLRLRPTSKSCTQFSLRDVVSVLKLRFWISAIKILRNFTKKVQKHFAFLKLWNLSDFLGFFVLRIKIFRFGLGPRLWLPAHST
jgi:hypothetical protein